MDSAKVWDDTYDNLLEKKQFRTMVNHNVFRNLEVEMTFRGSPKKFNGKNYTKNKNHTLQSDNPLEASRYITRILPGSPNNKN